METVSPSETLVNFNQNTGVTSKKTILHRVQIFSYKLRFPTIFFIWSNSPQWARASSFTRFLHHTQRHTTLGRTTLDERLARCSGLYLTTHNSQNRQTSLPPLGFEPTISAGERPQAYVLDRAATGTGSL
jgi:hypothetical protein